MAVKTRSSVGFFMDALGKIVLHLHTTTFSGQESRGWTVINVGWGMLYLTTLRIESDPDFDT